MIDEVAFSDESGNNLVVTFPECDLGTEPTKVKIETDGAFSIAPEQFSTFCSLLKNTMQLSEKFRSHIDTYYNTRYAGAQVNTFCPSQVQCKKEF